MSIVIGDPEWFIPDPDLTWIRGIKNCKIFLGSLVSNSDYEHVFKL